ncbi:response regulator transcription factor [Luteimonas sp. BDR2-5]|uniref:response regulator n=1 Tax=Proluteimonas luteida TaxID=2878685 RepID=UPI001E5DB0CA|nr:response regulator transcription factor [Luteimonas sp. BDR2-5]MCD9026793.1 response regulator transcription factor [Luteimonas sp. BDR2-5]
MRQIRVMIADDHPLLIEGVASVLDTQADMALVCEASDGYEAVAQFQAMRPDVVLMDLQMPRMDGIGATREIRRLCPDARVIVLTTYRGDVQALSALTAGARGYLLKSMLRAELLTAIREVFGGKRWIPALIAKTLAAHVTDETPTNRELQVLDRVAAGLTNKRIANELGIAPDTVKAHIKSLLAKLNASDRTHAVTIALRRGFMQLSAADDEPRIDRPAG